jgi:hypothetical protein
MASTDALGTYLNGHLAGANAGVQMARRLCRLAGDGPGGAVLAGLPADVAQDRDYLRELVTQLGARRHPVKRTAGWVGGKLHRLATGLPVTRDEQLSLLLEAEALRLGVDGKLALWEALLAVAPDHPELVEHDLVRLAARARDQHERIETVRLAAVRRAFLPGAPGSPPSG